MHLKRLWELCLPFLLPAWLGIVIITKMGWPMMVAGGLGWMALLWMTAPGVFWTYFAFINNNPNLAIKRLRKAVSHHPGLIYPYFTLGMMAAKRKEWYESLPMLEKAVSMASPRKRAYYRTILAEAYRESGASDKALGIFTDLLRQSATSAKLLMDLALTHLSLNNLTDALQYAEQARTQEPASIQPVLIMGKIHFKMGAFQKTKDDYEWAISRIKYPTESYYWLGLAELELGNRAAAIKHLKMAVERITEDPLLSDVTLEEAQAQLQKALESCLTR